MLLNRATVLITFLSTRGILHSGGSTYTLRPSFLPDYDPAMTKGSPAKIGTGLATWMTERDLQEFRHREKAPFTPTQCLALHPYESPADMRLFWSRCITSETANTPSDPELGNDWSSFLQTACSQ
eukprot:gene28373-31507_t